VETGAAARQASAGFIPSLAGRMAARFADMTATLDAIHAVLAGGASPPDLLAARNLGPGEGFAALDSARGRLYHRVRLDWAGRIVDYAIVAPTEWNFHPDGPFVRLLRGAWIGSGPAARRRVEQLAFVFDPCIGVEAQVSDGGHA
jgi:Ni,Fe-hydrogenase I large subunit